MLTKYLNPRNDIAFRKLFGTEDNKDLLIRFLNTILELKENEIIEEVDFINPWQAPRLDGAKQSIVDVLAKDKRGIRYIVEMQVSHTPEFTKRAQYYTAKTYVDQMRAGHGYRGLNSVYFIAITDYTMFPKKAAYKSLHLVCDQATGENDLKDFRFTFIELPKFTKQANELSSFEDQWLFFMKNAEDLTDIPSHVDDDSVKKAFHTIERFGWEPGELLAYEDSQLAIYDEQGRLDDSYSKGIAEGIEKGIEKGKVEGIAEGREEGEKAKAIAIAKTMLAKQISIEMIIECTGLTQEEISQYR